MCETKICSRCKEEKPILEFNREKRSKDGYNGACKSCTREYHNKYYSENKEIWETYPNRQEILDKKKVRGKERYRENREEVLAKNAEYYDKNKSKIYQNKKDWISRNKNKVKAYHSTRRSRLRKATPAWLDSTQKEEIFRIYLESVELSSETGEKYEVDHIIPLINDFVCGLHVPWNLRIITQFENRQKSNNLPEEYTQSW